MLSNTFRKRSLLSILLRPFTVLYGLVGKIRNFLYDKGLIKSYSTAQYSIVVGNLTVGGTGKTPLIEYLVQILNAKARLVTLSRGYGRKTKGFYLASAASTAEEIGDEPLQYYEKFGDTAFVSVCENRVLGSEMLNNLFPGHQVLLLDDAFQHRALRPDLSILLNDYNRPFYRDEPFPGGRLRESRQGARRAHAIITTKCPETLSVDEKEAIAREIQRYAAPGVPLFFSSISYGEVCSFEHKLVPVHKLILVAGIAHPEPLVAYVQQHYEVSQVKLYPDHYFYTRQDLKSLLELAGTDTLILTTEKDRVKLRPLAQEAGVLYKFAYLPIRVDFGDETERFESWLTTQMTTYQLSGRDR